MVVETGCVEVVSEAEIVGMAEAEIVGVEQMLCHPEIPLR